MGIVEVSPRLIRLNDTKTAMDLVQDLLQYAMVDAKGPKGHGLIWGLITDDSNGSQLLPLHLDPGPLVLKVVWGCFESWRFLESGRDPPSIILLTVSRDVRMLPVGHILIQPTDGVPVEAIPACAHGARDFKGDRDEVKEPGPESMSNFECEIGEEDDDAGDEAGSKESFLGFEKVGSGSSCSCWTGSGFHIAYTFPEGSSGC